MVAKAGTSDNLTAALEWLSAGCSVIPIRADGSKKPAIEWKKYQSQRPTEAEVRRWWSSNPEYGIAVITGAVSGGLEMTELEARATDGEHFDKIQEVADVEFDNWDKWVLGHRTYAEHTPSGGIHLLYRVGDGTVPGNTKIANNVSNECLAETRGEGGYVIVAPTGGKVHATGEDWRAINGCLPRGIQTIPFSLRNELHNVLKTALDERPPAAVLPSREAPQYTAMTPAHRALSDFESPGNHYERVTSWADILEPHGWTFSHHQGSEDFWVRPGKDPKLGHSASTGYAADRDRMYVFSSSAGLPIEQSLTKFYVYTELNHNGDFVAAATTLRRLGYGADRPNPYEDENWDALMGPPEQEQRSEKPAAASGSGEPGKRKLRARFLNTFTMQRVKWVWQDRIPLGEITLVAGREGTGKSTILAKWAAEITTGRMPGEFFGRPRRVIYIAAEDSWEKTIYPRLVAAGADPSMIISIDLDPECGDFGSPEFPVDCLELERMIKEYDVGVVMFDPLLSNISPKIDVNKNRELRQALEPLRKVAERTESAIIGLSHMNKSTGTDVSSKLVGSRAFTEVARAIISVAKAPREKSGDEEEEFFGQDQEFILDQEKNNLGACNFPGITYRIVTATMPAIGNPSELITTNRVEFTGETRMTVQEILNGTGKDDKEDNLDRVVAYVEKQFSRNSLLVSPSEVKTALGLLENSTYSALSRAVGKGRLSSPRRGLYGPPGAIGGGLRE